MSRARRIAIRALLAFAGLLILAAMVIEWQFGVFIPASRIDLNAESLELLKSASSSELRPPAPAVRVLIDPAAAEDILIEALRRNSATGGVPAWFMEAAMPYGAALVASYDFDTRSIHLEGVVNTRRLDGAIRRVIPPDRLRADVPQIDWDDGIQRPKRGLLRVRAGVPMNASTEGDVWNIWDHDIIYSPLPLEGGHLFEAVFDNRSGGAWLVIASLFAAFDFELDQREQDISLSSLQFVTRGRLTLDIEGQRDLRIRLSIDVMPQHVEKLGVVNLKIGLEDAFDVARENLELDHGIEMNGNAAWDEHVIRYDYRIKDADRLLDAYLREFID